MKFRSRRRSSTLFLLVVLLVALIEVVHGQRAAVSAGSKLPQPGGGRSSTTTVVPIDRGGSGKKNLLQRIFRNKANADNDRATTCAVHSENERQKQQHIFLSTLAVIVVLLACHLYIMKDKTYPPLGSLSKQLLLQSSSLSPPPTTTVLEDGE